MFSMLFGLKDQWSVIDDPRWSKMIQDSPNAHRISSQSLGADPLDIQVHEGHSDPRPRAAHEGHWVSLKLLRHSRWKHKDTKRWIQANHKSHKTIDLLISFNLLFLKATITQYDNSSLSQSQTVLRIEVKLGLLLLVPRLLHVIQERCRNVGLHRRNKIKNARLAI